MVILVLQAGMMDPVAKNIMDKVKCIQKYII